MRILAIDSSGLAASAAWMEDDTLLGEFTINYKKTHSQTLLPMMDELTEMLGTDVSTADAVAVSKGPGSFTGLRIGSSCAEQTADRGSDGRCAGVQSVRHRGTRGSDDGCEKKPGLHGNL